MPPVRIISLPAVVCTVLRKTLMLHFLCPKLGLKFGLKLFVHIYIELSTPTPFHTTHDVSTSNNIHNSLDIYHATVAWLILELSKSCIKLWSWEIEASWMWQIVGRLICTLAVNKLVLHFYNLVSTNRFHFSIYFVLSTMSFFTNAFKALKDLNCRRMIQGIKPL